MRGNCCGARAIQPEFAPRFRTHGDEALAAARIRQTHDVGRGFAHRIFIVGRDISDQHHIRALRAIGFSSVAHRLYIARIQVFQSRELCAGVLIDIVFDFDNGRHRCARLAEKLQTYRAHMRWHLVQNEARGSDDAVATFFLDTRQPG